MKRDRSIQLDLDLYPFTIRPMTKDEGEGFLIEYPDVLGCMSDGSTPEEAIENGRDALKACLLMELELDRPLPKPGSTATSSGQFRLRVPKGLHAWLTSQAEREAVSLNTLAVALLAEGRGRHSSAKKRKRRPRRAA